MGEEEDETTALPTIPKLPSFNNGNKPKPKLTINLPPINLGDIDPSISLSPSGTSLKRDGSGSITSPAVTFSTSPFMPTLNTENNISDGFKLAPVADLGTGRRRRSSANASEAFPHSLTDDTQQSPTKLFQPPTSPQTHRRRIILFDNGQDTSCTVPLSPTSSEKYGHADGGSPVSARFSSPISSNLKKSISMNISTRLSSGFRRTRTGSIAAHAGMSSQTQAETLARNKHRPNIEVLQMIGKSETSASSKGGHRADALAAIDKWKATLGKWPPGTPLTNFGAILRSIMLLFSYPLHDDDFELMVTFLDWVLSRPEFKSQIPVCLAVCSWCTNYLYQIVDLNLANDVFDLHVGLIRPMAAHENFTAEVLRAVVEFFISLKVSTFGRLYKSAGKMAFHIRIKETTRLTLKFLRELRTNLIPNGNVVVFETLAKNLAVEIRLQKLWTLRYMHNFFDGSVEASMDRSFSDGLCVFLINLYMLFKNYNCESFSPMAFKNVEFKQHSTLTAAGIGILNQYFLQSNITFTDDVYFNLFPVIIRLYVTCAKNTRQSLDRPETPEYARTASIEDIGDRQQRRVSVMESENEYAALTLLARNVLKSASDTKLYDIFIQVVKDMITGETDFDDLLDYYKFAVLDLNYRMEEVMSSTLHHFLFKLCSFTSVPKNSLENARSLISTFILNGDLIFYKPIIACLSQTDTKEIAKMVQIVSFLTDLLGETEFWFGLYYNKQDASFIEAAVSPSFRELSPAVPSLGAGLPSQSPLSISSRDTPKVSSLFVDFLTFVVLGTDKRLFKGKDPLSSAWYPSAGHIAMFVEFIWALRRLRVVSSKGFFNNDIRDRIKISLQALESRVALAIKYKINEQVPAGYKALLLNFLLELRLLTDSPIRPSWFESLIKWTVDSLKDLSKSSEISLAQSSYLDSLRYIYEHGLAFPIYSGDANNEEESTKKKKSYYFLARLQFLFHKEMVDGNLVETKDLRKYDSALVKDFPMSCLTALASLYHCIDKEDAKLLLPVFWKKYEDIPKRLNSKVTFLMLFCFELLPYDSRTLIFSEFYSDDATRRLAALRKSFMIFSERQYVPFQNIPSDFPLHFGLMKNIAIDTKRFQSALKVPISNVPYITMSIGSDEAKALGESDWLAKLKDAARNIRESFRGGLIVTKKKSEDYWEQDEDQKARDRKKRLDMNLSITSMTFFFGEESAKDKNKIKSLLPQVFNLISYVLADLLFDAFCPIFNMSRMMVLNFYRDDPAQFSRIFLNDLGSSSMERLSETITRLYRIILVRKRPLPSSFSHTTFNHLLGLIKWYSQDSKPNGISVLSQCLPIITELLSSLSGVGFKDIRKNRLEPVLFASGGVWFTEGLPNSMFPKSGRNIPRSSNSNSILHVSSELLDLMLLRISQANLMVQFLLRNPIEVTSIRKYLAYELQKKMITSASSVVTDSFGITDYKTIPSIDPDILDSLEHVGDMQNRPTLHDAELFSLNKSYKRGWINFIEILVSLINRNYTEVGELTLFFHEINWALIRYYHDIGIFKQCIALYLNTASRFRRLFRMNGFEAFLKPLFFLYSQLFCKRIHSKQQRSIRFLWHQCYLFYDETFILQMISILMPWILERTNLDYVIDPARGSTKERNHLDSFLSLINSISLEKHPDPIGISHRCNVLRKPVKQGVKPFSLDGLFKVLLNMIAFDLKGQKSENAVKMLVLLIPRAFDKPGLPKIVSSGIVSIIKLFSDLDDRILLPRNQSQIVTSKSNIHISADKSMSDSRAFTEIVGTRSSKIFLFSAISQFYLASKRHAYIEDLLETASVFRLVSILKTIFKDIPGNAAGETLCPSLWLKDFCKHSVCNIFNNSKQKEVSLQLLFGIAPFLKSPIRGWDMLGIVESICLLLELCNDDQSVRVFVEEKIIEQFLSAPITPDKSNLLAHTSYYNAMAKLFANLDNMNFRAMELISSIRKDSSISFLVFFLIPYCYELGLLCSKKKSKSKSPSNLSKLLQSSCPFEHLIIYIINFKSSVKNGIQSDANLESEQSDSLTIFSGTFPRRGSASGASNGQQNSLHTGDKTYRQSIQYRLVVIKLAICFARQKLTRLQPGIWTSIANFIESHLTDDFITEYLDASVSFLHFVHCFRTPLSSLLHLFTSNKLRFIRLLSTTKINVFKRLATAETVTEHNSLQRRQTREPANLMLPEDKLKNNKLRPISIDFTKKLTNLLRIGNISRKKTLADVEDSDSRSVNQGENSSQNEYSDVLMRKDTDAAVSKGSLSIQRSMHNDSDASNSQDLKKQGRSKVYVEVAELAPESRESIGLHPRRKSQSSSGPNIYLDSHNDFAPPIPRGNVILSKARKSIEGSEVEPISESPEITKKTAQVVITDESIKQTTQIPFIARRKNSIATPRSVTASDLLPVDNYEEERINRARGSRRNSRVLIREEDNITVLHSTEKNSRISPSTSGSFQIRVDSSHVDYSQNRLSKDNSFQATISEMTGGLSRKNSTYRPATTSERLHSNTHESTTINFSQKTLAKIQQIFLHLNMTLDYEEIEEELWFTRKTAEEWASEIMQEIHSFKSANIGIFSGAQH